MTKTLFIAITVSDDTDTHRASATIQRAIDYISGVKHACSAESLEDMLEMHFNGRNILENAVPNMIGEATMAAIPQDDHTPDPDAFKAPIRRRGESDADYQERYDCEVARYNEEHAERDEAEKANSAFIPPRPNPGEGVYEYHNRVDALREAWEAANLNEPDIDETSHNRHGI